MKKITLFKVISLFIFCLQAPSMTWAKSIWIQVVGIQEKPEDQNENFEFFYQEAAAFWSRCRASDLKPECHLLMNSDISLAGRAAADVRKLGLPDSLTPTLDIVNSTLQAAFRAAGEDGTVILTLTSHGTPAEDANSCVVLNSDEMICESDLAQILKSKPASVRVLVNAEGCFGGGFVDLSSPEVCVTTRVDRRSGAVSAGGFFWQRVLEQNKKSLLGFRDFIGSGYAGQPILGSESIKSLICRETRERVFKKWPHQLSIAQASAAEDEVHISRSKPLPPELNTTYFGPESLSVGNDLLDLATLKSRSEGFLLFLDQARPAFRCDALGLQGELCEALKKIMSPEFRAQIQSLQKLTKDLFYAKNPQALHTQHDELLQKLLQSEFGRAWAEIGSCFFNVEQTITVEEQEYLNQHRPRIPQFPRKFNPKDLDQAVRCEKEIQF